MDYDTVPRAEPTHGNERILSPRKRHALPAEPPAAYSLTKQSDDRTTAVPATAAALVARRGATRLPGDERIEAVPAHARRTLAGVGPDPVLALGVLVARRKAPGALSLRR